MQMESGQKPDRPRVDAIGQAGSLQDISMALQSAGNAKAIFRHQAQMCVRRIGEREPASGAGGIDRKEVDEDFADNFVRQRQDRILVGIESPLSERSLTSQHGKTRSVLENLDRARISG
jgi:hypothetical protein